MQVEVWTLNSCSTLSATSALLSLVQQDCNYSSNLQSFFNWPSCLHSVFSNGPTLPVFLIYNKFNLKFNLVSLLLQKISLSFLHILQLFSFMSLLFFMSITGPALYIPHHLANTHSLSFRIQFRFYSYLHNLR